VRLRFPGYEHSNIVDGVPEGWEKKPFSELADFVNGYPFKPADLGDDGLPVVKIPELRSGVTSNTPKNLGELIPEKYFIDNGSLLFSWSGTLLVNFWFGGTAILNQHLFHVIEYKSEHKSLLYFAIKHHMEEFLNLSVGATMKHIRKSALTDVKTMIPSDSIMGLFNNTVSRNLAQIGTLTITNHKLKQARDILLPKLINGEIAV
jgi:type I restriction enzyme, S subunit